MLSSWKVGTRLLLSDEEAKKANYKTISHNYKLLLEEFVKTRYNIDKNIPVLIQNRLICDLVRFTAVEITKYIEKGLLNEKPESEDAIIFVLSKL